MKKLLALLMVMVMVFAFAGCGKDKENTANSVDNNNIESSTTEENKDNAKDSGEITIEDVKNAKETDASLFEYEEVDGGVSITGFNGEDEIVVIPEQIDGKNVVLIAENSFINNSKIRGLKVSDYVHTIGDSAFTNCTELEVFISGDSVKTLESYSFNACTKLREVELNQGLESMIQCFNFANISKIEIPSSVKEMFVPFLAPTPEHYITITSEAGSYVEQYINEYGEEYHLIFQAK